MTTTYRTWICSGCGRRKVCYGGIVPSACACGSIYHTDTRVTAPFALTKHDRLLLKALRIDSEPEVTDGA